MSKNTLRRLANSAEGIARRQGYVRGRNEAMEETIGLESTNAKLLRALKRTEKVLTAIWTFRDQKEGYEVILEARAAIARAEGEKPKAKSSDCL